MRRPEHKIKNVSGIYQIRNLVNGKIYVGRTKCFYRRYAQYLHSFKKTDFRHINDYLLNAMKKYGLNNFSFEILEICPQNDTPERELSWINIKRSTNKNFGYNLRKDVDGKMSTHPLTSRKISERLKKEWQEGKRKSHSEKLKSSWNRRDREAQGKLLSSIKTKYVYRINDQTDVSFQTLKILGLETALSSFHRTKRNRINLKGLIIERFLL